MRGSISSQSQKYSDLFYDPEIEIARRVELMASIDTHPVKRAHIHMQWTQTRPTH